jgi:hypothetical protein
MRKKGWAAGQWMMMFQPYPDDASEDGGTLLRMQKIVKKTKLTGTKQMKLNGKILGGNPKKIARTTSS